jgi:hypothetical protein
MAVPRYPYLLLKMSGPNGVLYFKVTWSVLMIAMLKQSGLPPRCR